MLSKLLKNDSAFAFLASVLSKTIVTAYLFYQSFYLNKIDFGNLSYFRSISMSAIFLGAFGLGPTIIYYFSNKEKDYYPLLLSLIRVFPLISFLVVFIYVKNVFDFDVFNFWNFTIASLALFTSFNLNLQSLYYSEFKHKKFSLYSIIGSLALIIIGLPLTYSIGLKGAFLGFLISQMLTSICLGKTVLFSQFKIEFDQKLLEVFKFAIPIALSALFVYPTFFLLKSIIKNNSGIEFVGSFEIADQMRMILMFVPSTIGLILFPKMYALTKEQTFNLLKKVLVISLSFVVLSSTFLLLFRDFIIEEILYKYKDSFYPILYMNFSILFSSLSVFLGNVFIKKKLVWLSFMSNFSWATITILSGLILLKSFEPVAATSLGILLGYFSLLLFQLVYIKFLKIEL
jgi:O-antigen/teichoic acid export membrane protein